MSLVFMANASEPVIDHSGYLDRLREMISNQDVIDMEYHLIKLIYDCIQSNDHMEHAGK